MARDRSRTARPGTARFRELLSSPPLAIPLFYLPALFYGSQTNYTVVDTWRFWIIHLWVEGFFEFFVTVIVAVILYQLGLVRRNHGASGHLSRCHSLFRWWTDRHRPSLVLDGPDRIEYGDVCATFSALEVVPLTPAHARCVGFRAHDAHEGDAADSHS